MSEKRLIPALLCLSFLAGGVLVAPAARASVELDRKYTLETIGFLRSWDNVDGVFSDYVSAAYKDYFARQSRFVLQDLSKADALLTQSKLPYGKVIDDPNVLGQLARSTRTQSLIRTKIQKEGRQYRFNLEWLHSPAMDVMARETLIVQEPSDGSGLGADELKAKLQQALDRLIHRVPFIGSITGRDNNSITVNIGTTSGVSVGDTLLIGTIDEVKRHPLLKEIVQWRFSNTGKVLVDQVDEKIAFGHVIEEDGGHQILRQQKIFDIHHAPASSQDVPVIEEKKDFGASLDEPPRLGWVLGGFRIGSFSRQYSTLNNTSSKDGSGLLIGAKADSQIWITREWFGELGFDLGIFGYSQKDTTPGGTGAESSPGSGSLLGFKLAGGYSYLLSGDLLGPKGWVKFGYNSTAFTLPMSAADQLASITFKSVFVGLGADVPVRDNYGAFFDLKFGVFNSVSEASNLHGSSDSSSNVGFQLGGYYRYKPRVTLRVTVDFDSFGADFKGTTQSNISQKVITLTPAVLYYF